MNAPQGDNDATRSLPLSSCSVVLTTDETRPDTTVAVGSDASITGQRAPPLEPSPSAGAAETADALDAVYGLGRDRRHRRGARP